MLEAPADVLVLSIKIPLVPPVSAATLAWLARVGMPLVLAELLMSNAPTQPPAGGEVPIPQLLTSDRKRKSSPLRWFESVMLGLKNSVNGEQLVLAVPERSNLWVAVPLMRKVAPEKGIVNSAGFEFAPPLLSGPHT